MRLLRLSLAVSLLINLFLIGAVVGGALWVRVRHPMIAAGSLRIAGSELPPNERKAFRAALQDTRRSMRPSMLEGRAAQQEAADLLRQPILDQAAVLAALDRARAADLALRAAVEARAVGFAATLPQADRAKLADAIEARLGHHRGKTFSP